MATNRLGGSPACPTGILYHPSFSKRSYLTQGSRLQDFPQVLLPLLNTPRFRLIESPPISEELILQVHTPELLESVRRDPLCSTAWHSAGGVVLGAEMIARGEIRNAFAFIGAGGHHSGRRFFGGYCCFNDVVLAIAALRHRHAMVRIAILDTDAHHGDGTRDLIAEDPDVLHVCVCSSSHQSQDGTKVDLPAPTRPWFAQEGMSQSQVNALYLRTVQEGFEPRLRDFQPDFLFWYFGFDTHQGDYGDMGLNCDAYVEIARMMVRLSNELCAGRLEVVLGGGSRRDLARFVIPALIAQLGG